VKYFLGVDVGNTKSHALVADELGRAVGFSQSGPGSWEAVGWAGARKVLHDIIDQTLDQADITRADIYGAGFGFAGYDWPEDRPGHEALVKSLELINASSVLGNDTLVGLAAGAKDGWGVVVVAGTSNNCRGWDSSGVEGRVTGDGPRFAEYGGAQQLVGKAIQAVALAWTKRGPQTALSNAFIELAGAADVGDLLSGMVRNRYHLPAAHAPIVFDIASQGDIVAQEIIRWAGRELGSLTNGVIRQLELQNETFDVVLSGSLYKGSPALKEEMGKTIRAVAANAHLVRLQAPPVIGGVLLGLQQCGLNTAPVRQILIKSTSEKLLPTTKV
jgi:N-acetylglucosamine kinase-like BadF-type ATPase